MTGAPQTSVFGRLFAIFFIAGVLILAGALAAWYLATSSPNVEISLEHLDHYAALMTAEIGTPPDLAKAEKLAADTKLHLAIVGPGVGWGSRPGFLKKALEIPPGVSFTRAVFREPSDFVLVVNSGDYRYYYSEFPSDHRTAATLGLLVLTAVLMALLFSFLMVRRLLRPLRVMNRVARDFGVSDWKQRVPPGKDDEIGLLGRTLNGMADRIEAYILSMHDLLAAISHEIRSPLTRMKLALEFIDNPKIKESLAEEIQILDKLTGTVLEQKRLSTQPDILHRQEVDLHGWAAEACRPYQKAGQPVRLTLDGPDRRYSLDSPRVEMALRNLVENALRHAPGSPVDVTLTTGEPGFGLEVADQGPGMAPELLPRIGEPFLTMDRSRTGDRRGGGFGLGLSIVRAVADAHGARLTARNLEPRGFSVNLRFPGWTEPPI